MTTMVNLPLYAAKLEKVMVCYDDNELGGCGDAPKLAPRWLAWAIALLFVGAIVSAVIFWGAAS